MSLPLPRSLSPSKVSAFKDCALAFRFTAVDQLPQPPSVPAVKGTLVHRALERLFWSVPAGGRTPAAAQTHLEAAWAERHRDPEWLGLGLGPEDAEAMLADARVLVANYLAMEDPDAVVTIGTELTLEARLGSLLLRGIIDRLDLDPEGQLVVTDYKTGQAPGHAQEQSRLAGVHFYAFLCEQALGVRPAKVQLLYLRDQVAISTRPTAQSVRGLRQRAQAVWTAIERACRLEDFRPKPSALCDWCGFRAWCPAWGGDPDRARFEAGATTGEPGGPSTVPSGEGGRRSGPRADAPRDPSLPIPTSA
ncbi:MAG TPA: PD-(D/E)XK nuclease family protein [Acidimicrobiales bacterium]|nr:PD-(D/E)XK nuclease family protein [Acidimicrobiales bacterium]